MTAAEPMADSPHPLRDSPSPATVRAWLLPDDQDRFITEYEDALDEARRTRDISAVHDVVEHWRRIAILQTDPDGFRRTVRRGDRCAPAVRDLRVRRTPYRARAVSLDRRRTLLPHQPRRTHRTAIIGPDRNVMVTFGIRDSDARAVTIVQNRRIRGAFRDTSSLAERHSGWSAGDLAFTSA